MLSININIQADETGALSAREQAILAAMAQHPSAGPAAPAAAPTAAPAAPAKAAAAPKAKAAPKPEPEAPAAAPAEDVPMALDTTLDEPTAEEPAATTGEYTLDDAVTLATELVSGGKATAVKAALAAAGGAKRVSELKGTDAIAAFMAAAQAA